MARIWPFKPFPQFTGRFYIKNGNTTSFIIQKYGGKKHARYRHSCCVLAGALINTNILGRVWSPPPPLASCRLALPCRQTSKCVLELFKHQKVLKLEELPRTPGDRWLFINKYVLNKEGTNELRYAVSVGNCTRGFTTEQKNQDTRLSKSCPTMPASTRAVKFFSSIQ